jgi:HEAT repeat protein
MMSLILKRFAAALIAAACLNTALAAQSGNAPTGSAGTAAVGDPPAASPTASDAEKELAANLEKARRTLKYGIDSMVVSVIKQSMANKDKRLSADILGTLDSINPEVQKASVDYFIALKDWSPHAKVVEMLGNYNDYSVDVAVRLLRFLQEEQAAADTGLMALLLQMSQSAKIDLQAAAVDTITACGSVEQVDGLIKLFKKSGTSQTVRSAIVRGLGKYPTADSTKLLKEIVGDSGEEKSLRYEAITALGKQGQLDNLTIIKPSLTSKDVFERGAAINALAGFPTDRVLPLYQQALRDEMWRNRVSVLKVVADKKLAQLEDAVMFAAEDDPEKPVRAEAIRTLGTLGGERGWQLLRRLFLEPKTGDEMRIVIVEQLAGKNYEGSADAFRKVMETEWTKEKSVLLESVCRELASAKNPGAVGLYEKMLGHANFIIRIYGVRGIKDTALESHRAQLQAMLDAKPVPALKSSLEDALK